MTRADNRGDWQRLAHLLVDRRIQLGAQYRNRLKFASETGLNERLVSDLENARRERYRDTTLKAVEVAYRLKPGSIQAALNGGDLMIATDEATPASTDQFNEDDPEVQHLRELQAELETVLNSMSKRDRRRWEREMMREEVERLERWRRLMGGNSPIPD